MRNGLTHDNPENLVNSLFVVRRVLEILRSERQCVFVLFTYNTWYKFTGMLAACTCRVLVHVLLYVVFPSFCFFLSVDLLVYK